MEKGIDKKKLIFSIVLTILMFSVVLVSAQNLAKEYWDRWIKGDEDFKDEEAKILIAIIIAIVLIIILTSIGLGTGLSIGLSIAISILLTSFVTPDAIIGIFKSYDLIPLVIATIVPLLLFFGLTYISVQKGNRALMTLQWITWIVFALYLLVFRFILGIFLNLSSLRVPERLSVQWAWYLASSIIQFAVALIMSIGNGFFMNAILKMTIGVSKQAHAQSLNQAKQGLETLKEIGKAT